MSGEHQKMNFEQSMKRLEEIVKLLEQGDAPLEQALSLFEEGTALVARCNELLSNAEQQVVKISKGADGEPREEPFPTQE